MRLVAFAALALPLCAHAEIFRCMDSAGVVHYSLTRPTTACHAPRSAPARTQAPIAKISATDFPRVDGATQRARDTDRRRILENELADELRLRQDAGSAEAAERHERNIEAIRRELAMVRS